MIQAILDFVYPKMCLYCKEIQNERAFLCASCREHFTLLSQENRCHRCFMPKENMQCVYCKEYRPSWKQRVSLFSTIGPQNFLWHNIDIYAKEIACLIYIQTVQHRWPSFQYIYGESDLKNVIYELKKFYKKENCKKTKLPLYVEQKRKKSFFHKGYLCTLIDVLPSSQDS